MGIGKNKNYPLNDVKRITDLRQLIEFRAESTPDRIVFKYPVGKDDIAEISYKELSDSITSLGTELLAMNHKNSHIAILGENSYKWLLAFFSVVNSGNIAIPIDKEMSYEDIGKQLKASDTSVLIYSETYSDIAAELKKILDITFISMDEIDGMVRSGYKKVQEGDKRYYDNTIDEIAVCAIIYTSGTTGVSKGVMLSHKNFALDTYSACRNYYCYGDTVLLLPLHHTFGLVAGVFVTMLYGYSVYINKSLRNISADLIKARPQGLFLVPLFVETLYKNMWKKIESSGKAKQIKLLITVCRILLSIGIDIRRKVFEPVLQSFGSNLDIIISGGAPLNPKYIQGFRDIGIELLNGYGITECSPVVAVNRNKYYRDGSVGQILKECDVSIIEPDDTGTGEVCVSGNIIMQGYYNMPDETSQVLKDSIFHTGDLGYIDDDGFLFITGRKKNLIIRANGENVSPEELEERLLDCELIKEVVVYENDGNIMAEIYPDKDNVEDKSDPAIKETISIYIKEMNRSMPAFKRISDFSIRDIEFDKTTTKKIKRRNAKPHV